MRYSERYTEDADRGLAGDAKSQRLYRNALRVARAVNIGQKGLELIKSYEKCRLKAYLPTPADVPTIGWGKTSKVSMGDTCTQDQADAWFLEDIDWVEKCVNKAVAAQLTQNEFSALCSLCFNIGCKAFSGSTLVRLLNNGDFDGASAQFLRWDKQAGQVLDGLTRRRREEVVLFETV